jgi:broad specificity phosphatase PhoE
MKYLLFAVFAILASAANAQEALILVRHAELLSSPMSGPKQVPLSEAGADRARRLASLLKDAGIDAIYVTDFVRTQKTAEPLSQELHKPLTMIAKGDPRQLLERLRASRDAHAVLVVGHSDTLPGLLKTLGYPGDIKIEAQDYGNIFVVMQKSDGAPAFLRLRY